MTNREHKDERAARRGSHHPRSWRRWRGARRVPSGSRTIARCIAPEPGTELVLKTDPVAEGVHFLADDAPEDIAWKALAVNVSDLAAKACPARSAT